MEAVRPASDVSIDKNDVIYVADDQSNQARNPGFKTGIRIGSAKDGKVTAFIPTTRGRVARRSRLRRCRQCLCQLDRQDGRGALDK